MKSTSFRNAILTSGVFISTMFATSDIEAQQRRNPAPARRPVPAKKDTVVQRDAQGRPIPKGYVIGGIQPYVPDTAAIRAAKEDSVKKAEARDRVNKKPQTLRTRVIREFYASNPGCLPVKELPHRSTYANGPKYMTAFNMCVSSGSTADTLHIFSHNDETYLDSRASIEIPEIDPDSVAAVITHGVFVRAKGPGGRDNRVSEFTASDIVSEGIAFEHTGIASKFSSLADYNLNHSGVTNEFDGIDLRGLATRNPLLDRFTMSATEKMSPRDAQRAFSCVVTRFTQTVNGRHQIHPDFTPVENFFVYVADEVVKRGEICGVKLPPARRTTYRLPNVDADTAAPPRPQ